jgi:hypothetical protein
MQESLRSSHLIICAISLISFNVYASAQVATSCPSCASVPNANNLPSQLQFTLTQNGQVVGWVNGTGLAPGAQLTVYVVDQPNGLDFNGQYVSPTATAPATATGAVGAIGTAAAAITTASGNPAPIVINTDTMPALNPDGTYVGSSTQNPISVVKMAATQADIAAAGCTGADACTTPIVDGNNGAALSSTTVIDAESINNPAVAEPMAEHEFGHGVLDLADSPNNPSSIMNPLVTPDSPKAPTIEDIDVIKEIEQPMQKSETPSCP